MIKRKQINANTENVNTLESKQSNIMLFQIKVAHISLSSPYYVQLLMILLNFHILMFPEYHEGQG